VQTPRRETAQHGDANLPAQCNKYRIPKIKLEQNSNLWGEFSANVFALQEVTKGVIFSNYFLIQRASNSIAGALGSTNVVRKMRGLSEAIG
jgi:hypothetical protein